jgi:hypothetical protein
LDDDRNAFLGEELLRNKRCVARCKSTEPHIDRLDLVHTSKPHFLKIYLNVILRLCLGLPSGLFPSGFPTKTLFTSLLSPTHVTCPAQLILLDFITRTILGEEYVSLSPSLCSFLHSCVTSSLLGPNDTYYTKRKFSFYFFEKKFIFIKYRQII